MPLPWFRRKKPAEQAPFAAASENLEVESLTVERPAAENAVGDDGQSTTTPTKRRRGTRGGRNRKKKPAEGAVVDGAETPADKPATTRERKTPERKPRERPSQARRRTPPKRAPLRRARTVGVGPPLAASARDPRPSRQDQARRRSGLELEPE